VLVVTVEVWPGGDEERRQQVGRLDIANLTGAADTAMYEAILRPEGTRAVVRGHRRQDGWRQLLARALEGLD
jgi:hypothetical protein